ncbi:MAG TPA: HIT domain-containing protein [Candidatus Paceibacterota bacterium]
MLYSEFIKKPRNCPFCEKSNPIIKEDKFSYITIATAPYHRHHLMVVPKRHIEKIFDATEEENIEMLLLIKASAEILTKLGYKNYSILVREGDQSRTGKSVPHLHYHIVPDTALITKKHEHRTMMTEVEIDEVVKELKNIL